MSKKKEDVERIRKAYAPRGTRSQVRVTFLLDAEHYEHLQAQSNKGRYINSLIAKDRGQ